MERKNAWAKYKEKSADEKKLMKFCEEYRVFISTHKTERECADYFAAESGFKDLKLLLKKDLLCCKGFRFKLGSSCLFGNRSHYDISFGFKLLLLLLEFLLLFLK